jgi:hypothetical protein
MATHGGHPQRGRCIFGGRAQRFRAWRWIPHRIDVIASAAPRQMHIVNPKAGSRTLRAVLRSVGADLWSGSGYRNATCSPTSQSLILPSERATCLDCLTCKCPYTTTQCFSKERLAAAGIVGWSFVRDPIGKFESGAHQLRVTNRSAFGNMSADAILSTQLRMYEAAMQAGSKEEEWWLDGHLKPSTFRLSGRDASGSILWPHFVGRLELLSADKRHSDWFALLHLLGLPLDTTLPTEYENKHPLSATLSTEGGACAQRRGRAPHVRRTPLRTRVAVLWLSAARGVQDAAIAAVLSTMIID